MDIQKIRKALEDGLRVYALYTSGIYKGQITSIKTLAMLEKDLTYGDMVLHKIISDKDTLRQMISRA